jgi:hypothetical protein
VGNAATVVTNANLTGHVTSVGNAAVLGSFTTAELNAAISDGSINVDQTLPTDFVSAASGGTFGGGISVEGNILLTGDATTTNQGRLIDFTGFDKEGVTDFSDRATIAHTTNVGGHAGSVLVITSQNDSGDGIAFTTNATSLLKHNGNALFSEGHKPTYSEIAGTVPTWNQSTTGNASTATKVAINSGFSGTYPMLVEVESSGTIYNNTNVTYNGTSNTLTSPNFSGNLTGNVTGNATTATWADTVDVNLSNSGTGEYNVMWNSGDTVYSTNGITINRDSKRITTPIIKSGTSAEGCSMEYNSTSKTLDFVFG